MYSTRSGLILGFHGCDIGITDEVINSKALLEPSTNTYDWLGPGIYFWENSPTRAFEYAQFLSENQRRAKRTIKKPAVLGAVIDLGMCLDLVEYENLQFLQEGYELFKSTCESSGIDLPINRNVGNSADLLLRDLDCAVIQSLHTLRESAKMQPFDSVRGVFVEGEQIYPHAGFREKNHIQLCIRNPNCIKGFFIPRTEDENYPKV
ncbi:hypothetical protein [Dyadobacter bucti]|uniref:hypothetical protein n=1 Tax=Dyadobacter bucti TaxID=2572203 RepID=UPI003F70DB9A